MLLQKCRKQEQLWGKVLDQLFVFCSFAFLEMQMKSYHRMSAKLLAMETNGSSFLNFLGKANALTRPIHTHMQDNWKIFVMGRGKRIPKNCMLFAMHFLSSSWAMHYDGEMGATPY